MVGLYPGQCGHSFLTPSALLDVPRPEGCFLLRLADFCGAPRRALAKTGARRQRRLPVSSTGRGRRRCPSGRPLSWPMRTFLSDFISNPTLRPFRCPPALRARPGGALDLQLLLFSLPPQEQEAAAVSVSSALAGPHQGSGRAKHTITGGTY